MFGYLVANLEDATEEEKARYRSLYCGLCRALGKRCGQGCRMALTYDMVFLVLLHDSLYEPAEERGEMRCLPHPLASQAFARSRFTDYAADVTVALAYHKCEDDWRDDRKATARAGQAVLARAYGRVRERLPRQCAAIEGDLVAIDELERAEHLLPDEAACHFGRLMGELFVVEKDCWSETLWNMGYHLGRFIYLMDAVCDLEQDEKRGRFNPLKGFAGDLSDRETALSVIAGQAVSEFEKLPLEQDVHLLRNVLYSGVWQKYNVQFKKKDVSAERRNFSGSNPLRVQVGNAAFGKRDDSAALVGGRVSEGKNPLGKRVGGAPFEGKGALHVQSEDCGIEMKNSEEAVEEHERHDG